MMNVYFCHKARHDPQNITDHIDILQGIQNII